MFNGMHSIVSIRGNRILSCNGMSRLLLHPSYFIQLNNFIRLLQRPICLIATYNASWEEEIGTSVSCHYYTQRYDLFQTDDLARLQLCLKGDILQLYSKGTDNADVRYIKENENFR